MKETEQTNITPTDAGTVWKLLGILLSLRAIVWLITGRIVMPYKGIYVEGIQTRIFSILLLIFFISPFYFYRKRKQLDANKSSTVNSKSSESESLANKN